MLFNLPSFLETDSLVGGQAVSPSTLTGWAKAEARQLVKTEVRGSSWRSQFGARKQERKNLSQRT